MPRPHTTTSRADLVIGQHPSAVLPSPSPSPESVLGRFLAPSPPGVILAALPMQPWPFACCRPWSPGLQATLIYSCHPRPAQQLPLILLAAAAIGRAIRRDLSSCCYCKGLNSSCPNCPASPLLCMHRLALAIWCVRRQLWNRGLRRLRIWSEPITGPLWCVLLMGACVPLLCRLRPPALDTSAWASAQPTPLLSVPFLLVDARSRAAVAPSMLLSSLPRIVGRHGHLQAAPEEFCMLPCAGSPLPYGGSYGPGSYAGTSPTPPPVQPSYGQRPVPDHCLAVVGAWCP